MFAQSRHTATSSATLSVPAVVQFGDTFDVTYGLESLKQGVYAQDITIKYDAAKLELVGQPVSLVKLTLKAKNTAGIADNAVTLVILADGED